MKEIEVNNYDIDAMGIVSNIVYIRWFEDLRTIILNEYMTFSEMMKQTYIANINEDRNRV